MFSSSQDPDFAIAAWFQLASFDEFNFKNTRKRDVVIRTTEESQRILIGPTPENNDKPSLLTLSSNSLFVHGDVSLTTGHIKGLDEFTPLKVNGVSFSNQTMRAQHITIDNVATFRNELNANLIKVGGEIVFNEEGKLIASSILPHSISDDQIKRQTLTNDAFQPNTIRGESIALKSIKGQNIALETITEKQLAPECVTLEKYADYSIENRKINDGAVDARSIKPFSINTHSLSNQSVTSEKLGHNLSLNGDTFMNGGLSINTLEPFLEDGVLIDPVPPKDNNTSLDVYQKLSLIGSDRQRSYFFSLSNNIALNHENPQFTLDVQGSINSTDGLFQNGKQLLFSQWFSTPNVFNNCNLVYDGGFVGINERRPEEYLHIDGNLKTNSNIIFKNPTHNNATTISSFDSNCGINQSSPQATLDVGGNIAVRNTEIIDAQRRMSALETINVNQGLFINHNKDTQNAKAKEDDIVLDVNGNVRYDAHTFVINPFHMIISSKGEMRRNGPLYFEIAHLRSPIDSRNKGCFIIKGLLGETTFNRNGEVDIVISTRNYPTGSDLRNLSVSKVVGGRPSEIARFTDIELYEDTSNNRDLYVYLKTTFSSCFDLEIQTANIIAGVNEKWMKTANTNPPNVQKSELSLVHSLVHNQHVIHSAYGGKVSIGHSLQVDQDILSKASFCNEGNIVSQGHHIRSISHNKDRSLFEIFRHGESPSVSLSANAYKRNDDTWFVHNGEHGCLQITMENATNNNQNEKNSGAIHFKGNNNIMEEDNIAILMSPWVSIRDGRLGINAVTHPQENLHVRGNGLFEDGFIKINGNPHQQSSSSSASFLEMMDPSVGHLDSRSILWGMNKDSSGSRGENAGELNYRRNEIEPQRSTVSLGFDKSPLLFMQANKNIGFNVPNPQSRLHVDGNVRLEDSQMTFSTGEQFQGSQGNNVKIINVARTLTTFSSFESRWEKLATFYSNTNSSGQSEQPKNRVVVYAKGVLSQRHQDMQFSAIISVNTKKKEDCYSSVSVFKDTENFFSIDFDLSCYVDEAENVHFYIKSKYQELHLNIDFTFVQSIGRGIKTYDTRTSFNNIQFADDVLQENIAGVDNEIEGTIKFRQNVKNDAQRFCFHKNGSLSVGKDDASQKLDVQGNVSGNNIFLREGGLNTGTSDFIINGTSLVSNSGEFITQNIPEKSIAFDKLQSQTVERIWNNMRHKLSKQNIHLYNNGKIALFTPLGEISVANNLEIGTRLTLSSNISLQDLGQGTSSLFGEVQLTVGASNGLGINKPVPAFSLDVGGDINLTGEIRKDGEIWRTNPFRSISNFIISESNLLLGKDLVENLLADQDAMGVTPIPIQETLCVQTHMSLSNSTGKAVLRMRNGNLGLNLDQAVTTLDVGGGLGINNVEIVDSHRNIKNVQTISTPIFQSMENRVFIGSTEGNNFNNASHLLNVHGDINFSGNLLKNGIFFNEYQNQWIGSNEGVRYDGQVGIGTDIPMKNKESLSIFNAFSLSNHAGKANFTISPDAAYTYQSTPSYVPLLGLSNMSGLAVIKADASNIGLNYNIHDNFDLPNTTLDVKGNIGINGQEIINDKYVMSNIKELYTSFLTVKENKLGVNTRSPIHELSVNGSIGFDNENIVIRVIDHYMTVEGEGMVLSNIIINALPEANGIHINGFNNASSFINTQDSKKDEPTALLIKDNHATLKIQSTSSHAATYLGLYDAQNNYGFLGLEGNGLYVQDELESGTLTLASKHDCRFMTGDVEHMRVTKNGEIGVHTAYPMYSLDVAGSGIGLAGEQFVDVERNVFAKRIQIEEEIQMKNLKPNVLSVHSFSNLDLRLTGSLGGIRTTDKNAGDFSTFSNILNTQERGSVVMLGGSNIYLNATDNRGGASFLNIAYQGIQPGASLSGNSNVNVDVYVLDHQKVNNVIGNTSIVANTLDVINPGGHKGTTHLRLRNWNPFDIFSSASEPDENFFELRMTNDMNKENIVSSLHSDHQIKIMIRDTSMLEFSRNANTNVLVPQTRTFGLSRLSSGGVKQVYADNQGNLTSNSSDKRMKDKITLLQNSENPYGLDKLMLLRPVFFYWNSSFIHPLTGECINVCESRGYQREIGLIAQETREVFPECVGESEDTTLHIDYGKLVPVLIRSIQELAEENKKIKEALRQHLNLNIT